MFGWMLIFTMLVLGGTLSTVNGGVGPSFGMMSTVVFGFLLVVSAFTLLLRGRA